MQGSRLNGPQEVGLLLIGESVSSGYSPVVCIPTSGEKKSHLMLAPI